MTDTQTLPSPLFSRISFGAGLLSMTGILVMMFVLGDPFEILFETGFSEIAVTTLMALGVGGLVTGVIGLARKEPIGLMLGLGLGMSALALFVKYLLVVSSIVIVLFVVALLIYTLING